jgi:SNF2-related domain/Helicase conserved C-terminal domain
VTEPRTAVPSINCTIRVDGDAVVVTGPGLPTDRKARLFFASMLGGERIDDGWRIPSRDRAVDDLTIRVSRWLTKSGRASNLVGVADETVQRDELRRRSFMRTVEAARDLRDGTSYVSLDEVNQALVELGWNFAERTLRPHQMEAVIHGLTVANPANFSVPGAGKTASTLALIAVHMRNSHIDNVIVIGPLSCFRPWEDETRAALPILPTRRIRGTAQQRRARLRGLGPRSLALISYASAAADYRQIIEFCRSRNVLLVADESHRIKRFSGGTWAPAIVEIASYARVRVILSGTPMPQSGRDLFTQLNVMWPGRELTGPRQRFASAVDSRFGSVLKEVLPFVSRTPKSALGLRPPIVEYVPVTFVDEETAIYRLVVENFRRRVRAAGPTANAQLDSLRRGRPIRLLQASSNPALLKSSIGTSATGAAGSLEESPTLLTRLRRFDPLATPPSKFQAALELIQRYPDEKVVVWSAFIANLDAFSEFLRRQTIISVHQVDGRVQAGDTEDYLASGEEPETRERVIERFLDEPGCAVLVTNPASCSESISLHRSCRIAIYLDRTYDCAQWLQSIDRIHRLGLDPLTEVRIFVLMSQADGAPTADSLVEQSLSQKEAVMRELLEGATLSPFSQADDPLVEAEGDDDDLRALLAYLLGETR